MNDSATEGLVFVRGHQLRSDRKVKRCLTVEALSELCDSVSVSTIRRAEDSQRISLAKLTKIAFVLGNPVHRYIVGAEPLAAPLDTPLIAGEWIGYFVEADKGRLPYMVREDIMFEQFQGLVQGYTVANTPNGFRKGTMTPVRIVNRVMIGFTSVDEWISPSGSSAYSFVISRDDAWLEGFVTWYDPDSTQAEVSRYIAVRKSCKGFEKKNDEAIAAMHIELLSYKIRKYVELGHTMQDAMQLVR